LRGSGLSKISATAPGPTIFPKYFGKKIPNFSWFQKIFLHYSEPERAEKLRLRQIFAASPAPQHYLHAQNLEILAPIDGQHLVRLHKGHGAGEGEVVLKLLGLLLWIGFRGSCFFCWDRLF
jgi:hypothetical protein